MNELQKKLARRRSLNGEQFATHEVSSDAEACGTPPTRESPKSPVRKEVAPTFADGGKAGKASELQSKLARRRDLNGEAVPVHGVSKSDQPTIPLVRHDVLLTKGIQRADSNVSETAQSRTTSLTDSDGPAWLQDYASSVQTKEPFQSQSDSTDNIQQKDNIEPESPHDNNALQVIDIVGDSSSQALETDPSGSEVPEQHSPIESSSKNTNATVKCSEIVPEIRTDNAFASVALDAPSEKSEARTPAEAVDHVTEESNQEIAPAESATESVPATELPIESHASISASIVTTPAVEDAIPSPDSAEACEMIPALRDVPSRPPSASPTTTADIPAGADVSLTTAEDATPTPAELLLAEQEQVTPRDFSPPSSPRLSLFIGEADEARAAAQRTEVDTEQESVLTATKDETKDNKKVAQSSLSPQRTRGGWSPRSTATTTTSVLPALPAVDTGSSAVSVNGYPRANTNPGASAPSNGSFSPLRRTASLTGMTPTPVRKTSWYPGKFLIEGPSWGSKNTTPMMKMNPDQARSHYADLMSSSAKDVPRSASSPALTTKNGENGAMSAPKKELSRQDQRDEDLRTARIPESVTAGTSDDIIDMVLQLSRENSQLKKEVAHLKGKLAHQQVLLDAFQGASIEEILSDGDSASASASSIAAEPRDVVSRSTPIRKDNRDLDAQSLAANSDHTLERTSFNEVISPTHTPTASATKTRASKRFGARNYYSSFQSEESEDGLFGSEDVEEISHNNKYKSLTFDDLGELTQAGASGDSKSTDSKSRSDDASILLASSLDHNLDKLLRSTTGSSSRDHRDSTGAGRALIAEKYLVQSFRSTSANPNPSHRSNSAAGEDDAQRDWQTRFGHLGLISTEAEGSQSEERQLFNEELDAKARQRAAAALARDATMDYEEFIGKFTRTNELVDMTREFISSVLGPNGDATPPTSRKKLNYVFYGTHKLDVRCRQFFDQIEGLFLTWPEFKTETDERLICARDGIEQYIMSRIAEFAFKSSVDSEGDDILSKRMKLLSFLKPEALDIKPELFNETLLAIAADELRKINGCKTPGDKVACVVKSASVIFRSLSLSRSKSDTEHPSSGASSSGNDDTNIAGADDFLPLFIWVVMRSHIPRLCSNVAYVQSFLNPARLMGKWGYCLINLSSAIEFVKYIEADQLIIDPKEFDTRLTEAERELNGGFL